MSDASSQHALIVFIREHQWLAEPLVFILGFAEGIPVLSLLVPSSVLFLGIGAAQSAAGGEFWRLWIAAASGAVVGDLVTYATGRIFKSDVVRLWPLTRHRAWIEKGHAMFARWGILAVLGGKFTGFLRPFVPIVAGIVAMPFPIFLLASALSSLAWAGTFLAPGFGIRFLID